MYITKEVREKHLATADDKDVEAENILAKNTIEKIFFAFVAIIYRRKLFQITSYNEVSDKIKLYVNAFPKWDWEVCIRD